jgi:hypothetical protein
MTSIEQRRKPFGRHEGQDHGTRGTNRGKAAMRKALRTVQLDPEFADDPVKQKRMFKVDLSNMRWSMSYDKHADEASRERIERNKLPDAGDPVEDIPTEDEIAPIHLTGTRLAHTVHTKTGPTKAEKASADFAQRAQNLEESELEDEDDETRLSYLYRKVAGLIKELNNTPRKTFPGSWVSQTDLDRRVDELEGEIESIKEAIVELENGRHSVIPHATDAEMGLMTEKQREAYLQRKHGDMESDDEDDHGLDTLDNGVRAHKLPKNSWY